MQASNGTVFWVYAGDIGTPSALGFALFWL